MEESARIEHEPWPRRAALLAALGAALGLALDQLLDGGSQWTTDVLNLSAASFIAVGGIAFAFTLERLRALWSVWFGLACGAVAGLIFFWNGSPDGWSSGDQWRLFAAALATAVAAPLFQAARDEGTRRFRPADVHAHAWTNLVLWVAAWVFVLISWLLAQLLAELFNLIGIDLLRKIMRESAVNLMIVGGALGAAIGLLRDRDGVLGMMQRLVRTVLSVLAPVLAVGLALFVLALPFTGLQPLWDTTSATTPLLLLAIAGAFFLANAVIGDSPDQEAKGRVLRIAGMVLGAVMTPLALVAAISTWLRIDQHGFTPERLWALVFVLAVLAVALAYLWALLRGRAGWAAQVRPTNIRLALGICGIALLLATPLINFGAISTRDQVARLRSGEISPDRFDWAALRFDFGREGRRALAELGRQGAPDVRRLAVQALRATQRWSLSEQTATAARIEQIQRTVRVLPATVPLPADLGQALATGSICANNDCTLFWKPGDAEAIAIGFGCPQCLVSVTRLVRDPHQGWLSIPAELPQPSFQRDVERTREAQQKALGTNKVEIREVVRRQVYLNGEPVSGAF